MLFVMLVKAPWTMWSQDVVPARFNKTNEIVMDCLWLVCGLGLSFALLLLCDCFEAIGSDFNTCCCLMNQGIAILF